MEVNFRTKMLLVVVLIAMGGAVLLVWRWIYSPPMNTFDDTLKQARGSFYSDGDIAAIVRLEDAVKNAPSSKDEAQAKVSLADAYFRLNMDIDKSLNLFKEVAGNESYPGSARKSALISMYSIFDVSPASVDTFAKSVFTGSPMWESLRGADGRESLRNMCEWSITLQETALGDICIADWYAGKLLAEKLGLEHVDSAESVAYKEAALRYFDRADVMMAEEATRPSLNRNQISHVKKGIAYGMLYVATEDPVYKERAEDAFKTAEDTTALIAEAYVRKITEDSIILHKNMYLALLTSSGLEDHTKEIQAALSTRSSKDKEEVFIKLNLNRDKHSVHTIPEILRINIGNIVEEYGGLLRKSGWVF